MASKVKDAVVWYQKKVRAAGLDCLDEDKLFSGT